MRAFTPPRSALVMVVCSSLLGCSGGDGVYVGPCDWQTHHDPFAGEREVASLACDGVSVDPPVIRLVYDAKDLIIEINVPGVDPEEYLFSPHLYFQPTLPDGSYDVLTFSGSGEDPSTVTGAGAEFTGTFSFTRSRDIPFTDIPEPEAKEYTSWIETSFDLVVVERQTDLLGPSRCRLETGEQQVRLEVSGPVIECKSGPVGGGT